VSHYDLTLSISIVTFDPNPEEFLRTINSIEAALEPIGYDRTFLTIVDNSARDIVSRLLNKLQPAIKIRVIHGHGNVGFGRGHNLALDRIGRFHLILNPDVVLHPDALSNAMEFMRACPACGLASPHAEWPDGTRQYLCKRFPAVFDLILRGFAPNFIKKIFQNRLSRYEMQEETGQDVFFNPPIVSGCFMLFQSEAFRSLQFFDDKFFLYFEDFDISYRASEKYLTAYVPSIRIVHSGGNASRKGMWHIRKFIGSAILFYWKHGIKIF